MNTLHVFQEMVKEIQRMEEKSDLFNYPAGCCCWPAAYKASKLVEVCRSQVRMQSWINEFMNLFVSAILIDLALMSCI